MTIRDLVKLNLNNISSLRQKILILYHHLLMKNFKDSNLTKQSPCIGDSTLNKKKKAGAGTTLKIVI